MFILLLLLFGFQCTLRVCDGDHFYNRKVVDNFQRSYASRGQTVGCYYDPWNIHSGAILFAQLPGWQVFHTVFWPALAVACGLTACGLFCHRCRSQAAVAAGSSTSADDFGELGRELKATDEEKERGGLDNHGAVAGLAPSEIDSCVVAARAILERKKRNKKSLRNLWMVPRDV